MLDWLKPILGDGYNEEIDNKIAAEINKGFVAKADYDAAKDAQRTAAEALADANKALAEYKDTDIDGLRKSAEEWQAKAEQARGAVDSYQIVDVSMAEDGQSAVVYVDVTQTMKDGQSQKLYNQAISVKRDTGIWKVEVESIEPILFP